MVRRQIQLIPNKGRKTTNGLPLSSNIKERERVAGVEEVKE